MLQAQGLRTRVEIRVNRIPTALRRAKLGDLLLKYNEAKANPTSAILPGTMARGGKLGSPSRNLLQENQRNARHSPSPMRQLKRHRQAHSILDIQLFTNTALVTKCWIKRMRTSLIPRNVLRLLLDPALLLAQNKQTRSSRPGQQTLATLHRHTHLSALPPA